ncbi:MAG: N-ethylammeline chlorohydrolase [Micrococcales bacterium]|nr:MAG: N-ethylammeline chlorohydrolase [Micrococcales bacterium]PIE26798.1 MAG: N-ethylammeline chlorohydrolase [Micrococcales bacterium]
MGPPLSSPILIENISYLLTVDDQDTVLRDSSVLIRDGRIAAIGAAADLAATAPDAERIDGRGRLVMPGLVNLHTHTPMTLLRGLAEDVDLQGFLARVWAAEGAVMDPGTVQVGAELGALESLLGGCTTQLDMYFHHDRAHAGALRVGTRHVTGPTALDGTGPDGLDFDQRLAAMAAWPTLLRDLHDAGDAWVPPSVCPHGTYTVNPENLQEIRDVMQSWDEPGVLTIHASENLAENEQVHREHSRTPVRVLADSGLIGNRWPVVLGHGVHLDDTDQQVVAANGVAVAHCPGSNLKLASGAMPWRTYRQAGIRLGIGTDGCSSSNDLDMWQAMRQAALLARLTAGHPDVAPAAHIVRAATIDGAGALGMAQRIGSVEEGKEADVIILDLDAPHLTPVHDPYALLVFAAGRGDVTDVFVAGRGVVRDRASTRIDRAELLARARQRGRAAAEAAARA